MSRSFSRFFKSLNSVILEESSNPELNKIIRLSTIGIAGALTLGHCVYTLGTVKHTLIKINKVYKFDRNGFKEFMIVDHNGKHYKVNTSLWHWEWDSIEDWYKLGKNMDIVIKYYGWRVPLLGMFPTIIKLYVY